MLRISLNATTLTPHWSTENNSFATIEQLNDVIKEENKRTEARTKKYIGLTLFIGTVVVCTVGQYSATHAWVALLGKDASTPLMGYSGSRYYTPDFSNKSTSNIVLNKDTEVTLGDETNGYKFDADFYRGYPKAIIYGSNNDHWV
jgi:hypothetical protein